MMARSGWIAALGAASVALFVTADAEAAPVDNSGHFLWLLGGGANIVGPMLNTVAVPDIDGGFMESFIQTSGAMRDLSGSFGGGQPVTDRLGNPIMVPTSPPEPLIMALNVQAGTGTLNAIPGQEGITFDLPLSVSFKGGNGTFWCTTATFRGRFGSSFFRHPYTYDPVTGEGSFEVLDLTERIPMVSGCGGYEGFINSTLDLGTSRIFGHFTGRTRGAGPRGS